jgi:UDP-glucose 4-epimerase
MVPLKVVVTGASGFLGTYVLRVLALQENVETIAVTRREISGWCRVSDYSQSPAGDVLIHLAQDNDRAQVAKTSQEYQEKALTTLAALLEKGYSRVVYASSALLYGDACIRAHLPNDKIRVDDAYSHIKRRSELAVLKLSVGVVARLANIYGPGMSPNNVISTILRQLPQATSLEIIDRNPVRDFIWAEDAAEAVVALAISHSMNGNEGGLYNIGTGVGTSIGTLADMVLDIAGQTGRSVIAKCPSDRESSLILDFSATTAACGWMPKTTLQQGLVHLLNRIKEKT